MADTLIGYLPPGGWSEVATKGDLAELRADLRAEMAELRIAIHREVRTVMFAFMGLFTAFAGALIEAGRAH